MNVNTNGLLLWLFIFFTLLVTNSRLCMWWVIGSALGGLLALIEDRISR